MNEKQAALNDINTQQSTMKKLEAQGGVEGAVRVDTTEATIKAKTQEGVVDAQLKQAGAKDGLDSSVKDLAEATNKLAQTASTLAGGKTASDIATVEKFDSAEQYAESEAKKASAAASKDKGKLLLDKDQDANDRMVEKIRHMSREGYEGAMADEKEQQALDQMERAGLVTRNKDGSLKVATGKEFSDAMAVLNSGDMGRDKQVQIAGTSMNIDRDMDGNTRITGTSLDSTKRGSELDYSVSGFAGTIGVGMFLGATGLGIANKFSKHLASEKIPMTMEDMHGAKPDGKGGFVDTNGKGFSLNDNGEVVRDGKVAMKTNPNYAKGYIKAKWDNFREKVNGLEESSSKKSFNKSYGSENNKPTNKDSSSSSQSNKNDMSHDKTSKNSFENGVSSEESITKTKESGKSNIAQEIETQYKKEQILNNDAKYSADMEKLKATHAEQKALNPDNVNVTL